jgi:molybdopterin converting factor small subunit
MVDMPNTRIHVTFYRPDGGKAFFAVLEGHTVRYALEAFGYWPLGDHKVTLNGKGCSFDKVLQNWDEIHVETKVVPKPKPKTITVKIYKLGASPAHVTLDEGSMLKDALSVVGAYPVPRQYRVRVNQVPGLSPKTTKLVDGDRVILVPYIPIQPEMVIIIAIFAGAAHTVRVPTGSCVKDALIAAGIVAINQSATVRVNNNPIPGLDYTLTDHDTITIIPNLWAPPVGPWNPVKMASPGVSQHPQWVQNLGQQVAQGYRAQQSAHNVYSRIHKRTQSWQQHAKKAPARPPTSKEARALQAATEAAKCLGIKSTPTTLDELNKLFRHASRKHHPDHGGTVGNMQKLSVWHTYWKQHIG